VLLCAAALACGPPESVPSDLVGIWKTRAPRHAEAFLEIRPTSVMLGLGRQQLDVLEIEDLDISRDAKGNRVFRFYYAADTGEREVFVITRMRGRRAIRVGSGEGTWYPSQSR
jgi:hypothetical protein